MANFRRMLTFSIKKFVGTLTFVKSQIKTVSFAAQSAVLFYGSTSAERNVQHGRLTLLFDDMCARVQ